MGERGVVGKKRRKVAELLGDIRVTTVVGERMWGWEKMRGVLVIPPTGMGEVVGGQ